MNVKAACEPEHHRVFVVLLRVYTWHWFGFGFITGGLVESWLQDVETETPIWTPSEAKRIRESPSAKQYEYTFGGCIERLDFLEEVEQGSDHYLFAA